MPTEIARAGLRIASPAFAGKVVRSAHTPADREPAQAFRIIGEEVREDLQGHIPAELGIVSAVDLTHAAPD